MEQACVIAVKTRLASEGHKWLRKDRWAVVYKQTPLFKVSENTKNLLGENTERA